MWPYGDPIGAIAHDPAGLGHRPNVGGIRALEDFVHKNGGALPHVRQACQSAYNLSAPGVQTPRSYQRRAISNARAGEVVAASKVDRESFFILTFASWPLYPQKRPLVERLGMSALCQKQTHDAKQQLSLTLAT